MKKTFAVFAVAVAVLAGCSRPGSDEQAFEWRTELPAGSVVHLRNGAGSIEVKQGAGQTALVTGSRHWRRGRSRDVNFVVTQKGNEYYICAMWRNSGNCGARGYRGRNTHSFLSMFSLFNRNTDATADFVAELPADVRVDATNTNGEVTIDGITGGVTAHTVNGDVKVSRVGGKVSLQSTNGDVEMTASPGAILGSLALNTTNGDIRAELGENAEGNFEIATVNGDVRSDFPLQTTSKGPVGRRLRGQIGSASNTVRIRSVNGSVVVTRAGLPQQ